MQKKLVRSVIIEKGFNSQTISDKEKGFFPFVPQSKGKHARKPFQAINTPLAVGFDNHLSVGVGCESVPQPLQRFPNLFEVVHFTIIDNPDSAIIARHGLATSFGEVDHRQSSVPQTQTMLFIKKKARVIRAPMGQPHKALGQRIP